MLEELQKIGLNEHEAKVYVELLKNPESEASKIAKSVTINRSVTYSILYSLIEKGIVSFIVKNKVQYFNAIPPRQLSEYIKEKEDALKSILPSLLGLASRKEEKVKVELFEGLKGAKTVLKDIIKTNKDYIVLGMDRTLEKLMPEYSKQYNRMLNEKKLRERIIATEYCEVSRYSTIRLLPKEYQVPAYTTVYGDKVAIAIFTRPGYVILIHSKDLAKSYNAFFELMWKISR